MFFKLAASQALKPNKRGSFQMRCSIVFACLAVVGSFDPQRWAYNASLWWTSAVLQDSVDGFWVAELAKGLSQVTSGMVELAMRGCLGEEHPCEQDGLCFLPQIRQEMDEMLRQFVEAVLQSNSSIRNSRLQDASLDLVQRVGDLTTSPGCVDLQDLLSQGEICSFSIHQVLECGKAFSEMSRLMMSKLHSIQIASVFNTSTFGIPTFVDSLGVRYEDVLISLLREHHRSGMPLRAAEIGVHEGATSERLLMELPNLEMLLVDPFEFADSTYFESHSLYPNPTAAQETSERFWQRMKTFRARTVVVWQRSPGAASWVADGFLDLIFLDASHSYEAVATDLKAWLPKVARFGILAGHDYSLLWPGVCEAVHEFADIHRIPLLLGPDGLWWFRV